MYMRQRERSQLDHIVMPKKQYVTKTENEYNPLKW